jgi:nucleotide-binding universal stress UspA family protein
MPRRRRRVSIHRAVFHKIAIATDGSETADKALDVALDLADRYEAKLLILSAFEAELDRASAVEPEAPDDLHWASSAGASVDATLLDATQRALARGLKSQAVAREGDPAAVICDLAAELDADLLVIGNKGMERRVLGSVPNSILHHAPCTVVLAKTT